MLFYVEGERVTLITLETVTAATRATKAETTIVGVSGCFARTVGF